MARLTWVLNVRCCKLTNRKGQGVYCFIYIYTWDNSVLVFKKKNTYKTRHAAYKLPTQGPLTDSHKSQTPELTKPDTRLQLAEDYLSESLLYNTEGDTPFTAQLFIKNRITELSSCFHSSSYTHLMFCTMLSSNLM